ncbi:spore germination protein [Peribacillus frigoritolerans]|jgi:Bacillus/Clostridium GerA spore germination protein|uniref:spore germination protein n=1 Tax=Peribacillus frigoritolerans TaxID=450367 RepID=UPI0020BF6746|nr:spore germination protein [Peribacillus frigoritolerans]MED3761530.1 spore germination protein [Peribacillus frigoritolerans]WVN09648.1 spore germination protein [Peribacillus frigoritolerans]
MKKGNLNGTPSYIDQIRKWFEHSSDVVLRTKTFDNEGRYLLGFLYAPNLVDMPFINEVILPTISKAVQENGELTIDQLSNIMEISTLKKGSDLKDGVESILFSGDLIIINESSNEIYHTPLANSPKRSPEESNIESSIRGPRDGFVENIADNMSLIRQRLKTASLKCIEYTIGKRSKTKILLLYIDDIINPSILLDVKKRLDSLKADIIVSSYQVEELLYDTQFSIFPLMEYVGRPDYVVESLNQGRFAILVDGNPTSLIGPTSINQLLYAADDAHASFFYISFMRIIRVVSLFVTVTLPGFFIALVTYQFDQIPFSLLATISITRQGLPIPASLEAFVMIILFELFKEAGLRLPKAVGPTVSVLGGLIIGDAAIRAGLTSPSMLVIIAVTVLSSYTLINQNIAGNIVLIRLFIFACSAFLGLFGFFMGIFLILIVVVSLESFGQPFVNPFSKPNKSDMLKVLFKLPYGMLRQRNQALQSSDNESQKESDK